MKVTSSILILKSAKKLVRKTCPGINWVRKVMIQFAYLSLYFSIETFSCRLFLRMVRMNMDWILKNNFSSCHFCKKMKWLWLVPTYGICMIFVWYFFITLHTHSRHFTWRQVNNSTSVSVSLQQWRFCT